MIEKIVGLGAAGSTKVAPNSHGASSRLTGFLCQLRPAHLQFQRPLWTEHVELRDQRRMARGARRISSRKLQALDAAAIVKLQRGAGAICPRQQLDVPQLVIIARDTLWDRELSGAILNGLLAGIE